MTSNGSDSTTVFVVDDDAGSRNSIRRLITSVGLHVRTFGSAREFLDDVDLEAPGCVVTDVRMPGMSGLELHEHLAKQDCALPVILVTAFADVPMAVRAMHAGATDFIEKPYRPQHLIDSVQQAIETDAAERRQRAQRAALRERFARLSAREREVLDLVVVGRKSQVIATRLGVRPKTIHAHRAEIMAKLEAGSVAELVQMAMNAGLYPTETEAGGD